MEPAKQSESDAGASDPKTVGPNEEHENSLLDNSIDGDDVDGAKGKHKSKRNKKKREKKRSSEGVVGHNKGGAVHTPGKGEEERRAGRKAHPSPGHGAGGQGASTNSGTPSQPGSSPRGKQSSRKKKHKKKLYEEYWTKEAVSAALKRGEIYQGVLRISPKNYEMAWVTVSGFNRDVALIGMRSRNRALNGDVVAVELLPREKWSVMANEMRYHEDPVENTADRLMELKMTSDENDSDQTSGKSPSRSPKKDINISSVPEKYLQRTAKVVYIIEKKHPRVACGYLRPMSNADDPDALFSPTDSRLPRFRIPHADCPPEFFKRPQDFEKTLLIARMVEWAQEAPLDSYCALGCFARSLGEAGEIEPETDGILMVNDVDWSPFTDEVLACLPKDLPWKIPEEEAASRRDFRNTCVFTIDPATARDLDDAVHCDRLEDGTFEVGVHIADVSYFVKEGTALDQVASERATSTYMVQKVVPMLPRLLCEELCSLNPGEDRLTFSVVWKMSADGTIKGEWMGRGIICSRTKLAYQHAQEMIDNPEKVWAEDQHPPVSGGATISDIVERVCHLHRIAVILRKKRFQNGTLRLDQAKVSFDLDKETGLPIGWHPYIQKASNELIEEYMLLANMAVAHRIYDAFPEKAMLRCHSKPDERQLVELKALCNSLKINFEHGTSKSIQESLSMFARNSPEHLVLSHLSMKPMKPAKYFSSGTVDEDKEHFLHYALSVPLYTHFTSPIRRYPDVIVHRLLAAALKVAPEPEFTAESLEDTASHCNDRKLAAKRAGEASVELYLGVFIRECGPLNEDGIVVNVLRESLDVLIPAFGLLKRVYFKFCDHVKHFEYEEGNKTRAAKVAITWRSSDDKKGGKEHKHQRNEILTIFSTVHVLLATDDDQKKNRGGLRFSGQIVPRSEDKEQK